MYVCMSYKQPSGIEHSYLLTSVSLSNFPVSSFVRKECVKIVLIESLPPTHLASVEAGQDGHLTCDQRIPSLQLLSTLTLKTVLFAHY